MKDFANLKNKVNSISAQQREDNPPVLKKTKKMGRPSGRVAGIEYKPFSCTIQAPLKRKLALAVLDGKGKTQDEVLNKALELYFQEQNI